MNLLVTLQALSSNPTAMLLIMLITMILLWLAVWHFTGSCAVGLLCAESINLWNLTLIITNSLLDQNIKPFMPLWISLIILPMPYVYLILSKMRIGAKLE